MLNTPLFALVVIYNKNCNDSATCRALAAFKNKEINVIIYDNSTSDFKNKAYCQENGWIYLGGDGNKGLSKAYNNTIDFLIQNKNDGFLCLLDDDTDLSEQFISSMLLEISKRTDGKIFVPILTQAGKIISPTKENGSKFKTKEECLENNPKRIQAFNSCMTISLDIFENYRYDERIFLDGVDHLFIRDMINQGNLPYILPIECEHGFSGNQIGSKQGAIVRYRIIVKDYKILYENSKLKYFIVVGRRALHLCLQHKCLTFLKIFLTGK